MQAIVLDGHLKSALAAVRSLGRAGISVSVGSERKHAMAGKSRFAYSSFTYISPKNRFKKQFSLQCSLNR